MASDKGVDYYVQQRHCVPTSCNAVPAWCVRVLQPHKLKKAKGKAKAKGNESNPEKDGTAGTNGATMTIISRVVSPVFDEPRFPPKRVIRMTIYALKPARNIPGCVELTRPIISDAVTKDKEATAKKGWADQQASKLGELDRLMPATAATVPRKRGPVDACKSRLRRVKHMLS